MIFDEASKALLNQIETIVKLIRSKGIGYFITKSDGCSNGRLAQLGLKFKHALRAFTTNDRKAIKMTTEIIPILIFMKRMKC